MGDFEIPKAEKIKSAQEAIRVLRDLDDKIEKVSDLVEKEKKEIAELMEALKKKFSEMASFPDYLQTIIRDLENDLSRADAEFKIDSNERGKLAEQVIPPDFSVEFNEKSNNSQEIAQTLNLIYLQVVHNGVVKPIIFSQAELEKNPALKINGYIVSVMIFGTQKMDISMNGISATPMQPSSEDSFQISGGNVYFDDISTAEYPETKLRILFCGEHKSEAAKMTGKYFFGRKALDSDFLGNQVIDVPKTALQFKVGDKEYELAIEQLAYKPFEIVNGYAFHYLGNDREKFAQIDDLHEKLNAIADGVREIEEVFSTKLVDKVNLVDLRTFNATASRDQQEITFTAEILKKTSPIGLKMIARHELLHKYVDAKGYTKDERMRTIYADIKGFTGNQREGLIYSGWFPFEELAPYKNSEFLSFINEKNYFDIPEGGHSYDNMDEFVTPFFHTLMYIERLEANLDKPILVKRRNEKPETVKLTKAQKVQILDHYIKLLETLRVLAKEQDTRFLGSICDTQEEDFFEEKLEYVKKLRDKVA
jgi:hypothetical protein